MVENTKVTNHRVGDNLGVLRKRVVNLSGLRTAVPFWGQTTDILRSLSPEPVLKALREEPDEANLGAYRRAWCGGNASYIQCTDNPRQSASL